MPQEFHILRCFKCGVFQVDIVKKLPKWTCKLCGEKQSVIKVYGTGPAKDCRLFVQDLNMKRETHEYEIAVDSSLEENKLQDLENKITNADGLESFNKIAEDMYNSRNTSKWTEFTCNKFEQKPSSPSSTSHSQVIDTNKSKEILGNNRGNNRHVFDSDQDDDSIFEI